MEWTVSKRHAAIMLRRGGEGARDDGHAACRCALVGRARRRARVLEPTCDTGKCCMKADVRCSCRDVDTLPSAFLLFAL